jgi:PAS domain S-box-containing protein
MTRTLVETSNDWIWAVDIEGRHTYCNPAVESILGYGVPELVGRVATELLHPDDTAKVDSWMREWIEKKLGWSNLIRRWRHKNGSWRWLESSAVPILNANDELVGFRGIDRDITDRVEAEEKLNEMEAHLAHAGRLSVLGEMVAGIAHEVNQPLYSIVNFAKACRNVLARKEEPDHKELIEWNDEIACAAARATEIIKRLRRFARRGAAEFAAIPVGELIEESIDLMAFELRRHKVVVRRDIASDAPAVRADRVEIQQVLVNLLQNACEAMAQTADSERQIALRSRLSEEGVVVSVQDHGPGLPDDKELRIFQPFVTTKENGLGIGLAISTTIVEAHGGRLWASDDREGATFHLLLPYAEKRLGGVR